jgi:hypothetical protein
VCEAVAGGLAGCVCLLNVFTLTVLYVWCVRAMEMLACPHAAAAARARGDFQGCAGEGIGK